MTAASGGRGRRRLAGGVAAAALLSVLAGCGGDSGANAIKTALAEAPHKAPVGASVAFRFPQRGGNRTILYRLPDLDEVAWRFESGPAAIARTVGFASDEDLVYALTVDRQLVALDLTSGRARVIDTSVAIAQIGPEGGTFTVRGDGSIARINRRAVSVLADSFSAPPERLWVGVRSRLVAVVTADSGRRLEAVFGGQPRVRQSIPAGPVAVDDWGDLAAVGTDSGLVVVDPSGQAARRFQPIAGGVRLVGFSPSAHRIYAVTATDSLLELDRFELTTVSALALPGAAGALRMDPMGRYLLIRPAAGDSIWLADAAEWRLTATLPSGWDADVPQVAPDGTILLRRRNRVATFDADSLRTLGETNDPNHDHWLLAAWDPRRPALEVARDTSRTVEEEPVAGQLIYVQVASTSNEAWAADAARNLRRAGMNALVLPPDGPAEPYRVVLGPYPNREAAEEIRSRLQMPSWILLRDTTQHVP